jgi:geranylgeranyl diphosphate synthase, type I
MQQARMNLDNVLAPYINQVDTNLKRFLNRSKPAELYEAVRHLPNAGGKRLRPITAILSAQTVGGDINEVMPYATALELLHTYTLIHDDILDDDAKRRGVESVHKKYGVPFALLAGDTLHSLAFEALGSLEVDPALFREIVLDISRLSTEISEGQYHDMNFEKQRKIEEMDYYHMIERKTATMFEMAAKNGARIAGADPKQVKKLSEAGRLMGLAFQVWDDYLDVAGDEQNFGKQVFADIIRGKKTLIIVRALDMLDPFDRRKLHDAIRKGDSSKENIEEIMGYIRKSGAIEWTRDRAKEFSSHARTCLTALPENSARNLLMEICAYLVERDQ